MINVTPKRWSSVGLAMSVGDGPPPATKGARAWFIRHGLWIFLLLIVTAWELLGVFFPDARKVPEWWDHPTISQEMKSIIGTSLPGRVIASAVITVLGVLLTLHWAWRVV